MYSLHSAYWTGRKSMCYLKTESYVCPSLTEETKKGKNWGTKGLESGESRHSFGDKKVSTKENKWSLVWPKDLQSQSLFVPIVPPGEKVLELRQTGDNRRRRVVFVAHRGIGQPNTWDQRRLEQPKLGLFCHPDEGILVIPTWLNGQTLIQNPGAWKRRVPKSKGSESSAWLGGGKAYLGKEISPRREMRVNAKARRGTHRNHSRKEWHLGEEEDSQLLRSRNRHSTHPEGYPEGWG